MDILYVIGNRLSDWYNNELRYSLRCLERNGVNVGRVFVAGYKPPFLNEKEVVYIPCKDITNVKHYNIQNCIDYAVKHSDIGESNGGEFLYSSDDHFYIQKTDFAAYPYYWRGVMLPTKANNDYHRTLLSTRELLSLCKLPTLHLAWHGNTHFNARVWRSDEFQLMLRFALTMPEGCEPTCLMLNYMLGNGMLEMGQFMQREDCKFGAGVTDVDMFGGVLRARWLYWVNSHWTDGGGCKDYRTDDLERRMINMLIAKYPRYIRKVSNKASRYTIKLHFD